jgi:DNA-directed RNA polymerase omega subunit
MPTIASKIDVEKCTRAIGNSFEVVLVAAARARELRIKRDLLGKYTNTTPVQALRDIETGEIGRERLYSARPVAKKRR